MNILSKLDDAAAPCGARFYFATQVLDTSYTQDTGLDTLRLSAWIKRKDMASPANNINLPIPGWSVGGQQHVFFATPGPGA